MNREAIAVEISTKLINIRKTEAVEINIFRNERLENF
jgi:hypothetical protein